jgi:hypothetical protein
MLFLAASVPRKALAQPQAVCRMYNNLFQRGAPMARKLVATKRTTKRSSRKAIVKRPAKRFPATARDVINTWETDPGSGASSSGGQIIQRPIPSLNNLPLPTRITNPAAAPAPSAFQPGVADFRYWAAAEALRRGSDFWGAISPGLQWQVGAALPVDLDHGVDLNAFYDRIGLRFFHAVAGGSTVFSGESPDVVCHELGHAILDAIKPQLWNAASLEVAAFHESFGDVSAILCALQLQSLRLAVLHETANAVYRASRLSRLASQLGWAIRQSRPATVESDCLRSAVNSFFYRDPDTIPTQAPATSLSSESHSFSRVFTAAMFEGIANMFRARPAQDEQNLLDASVDAARILVAAIRAANVVPGFYSQVAAQVLNVAQSQAGQPGQGGYEQSLRSAFVRHGILPPAMAVNVAALAATPAFAAAAAAPVEDLPLQLISVAEYGLGVATIAVHAASQPEQFDVRGAALAVGAAAPLTEDTAAKSFFEDLLRRGRLKVGDAPEQRAQIFRADSPKSETYTHELKKEGGQLVLRRVRIDCCFC